MNPGSDHISAPTRSRRLFTEQSDDEFRHVGGRADDSVGESCVVLETGDLVAIFANPYP